MFAAFLLSPPCLFCSQEPDPFACVTVSFMSSLMVTSFIVTLFFVTSCRLFEAHLILVVVYFMVSMLSGVFHFRFLLFILVYDI